ncbi:hypothetical protein PspLS_03970 [Pyricularia sp. CBS 133598]|nr:hypothetical protein PspLS_03970 [Pyricularia sp. CBS 133598]
MQDPGKGHPLSPNPPAHPHFHFERAKTNCLPVCFTRQFCVGEE